MDMWHEVVFIVNSPTQAVQPNDVLASKFIFIKGSASPLGQPCFRRVLPVGPWDEVYFLFGSFEEAIINMEMRFPGIDIYVPKTGTSRIERILFSKLIYSGRPITEIDFEQAMEKINGNHS